jgi:hypothetical protein
MTPQIHKLNKVSKAVLKFSYRDDFRTKKLQKSFTSLPFLHINLFDDHLSTWSPSANLNVSLAANQSDQLS